MKPITPDQVKERREALGLSRGQLAKLANVSAPTMSSFEKGGQKPQYRTLKKLSDTLKSLEKKSAEGREILPQKKGGKRAGRVSRSKNGVHPEQKLSRPRESRGKAKQAITNPGPGVAAGPVEASYESESKPIRLSNLDLELITRILNMSIDEKLDLLKKII